MAIWQIINTNGGKLDPIFDDGNDRIPGEEGFDDAAVKAYAGPDNYNYSGTPNWTPLAQPEEEEADPA